MTTDGFSDEIAPRQSVGDQQTDVAGLATKVVALQHGARRRRGALWWVAYALCWGGSLLLLTAALCHVFVHDGTVVLTWINAFTRYVYLPAYVCLAWAAWQRRWALAVISLVVVAFHVNWMWPNFVRDRRFDVPNEVAGASDASSPTVRIFFANVYALNTDFTPTWSEIEAADPDIVVLVECCRLSFRSLHQSPVMTPYVQANLINGKPPKTQFGEVAVFSRLPIRREMQNWVGGRIIQTIDVAVGDQTLRLVGLHAPRPQPPEFDYFGYWDKVLPLLATEPSPLVVIGDFNATEHSAVYKQLQQAGLRSAHDDRGRGYATTWPNGTSPLPPIRIDQAFLSGDVECLGIEEGKGIGSDHKPLILDIRLRERGTPKRPADPPTAVK